MAEREREREREKERKRERERKREEEKKRKREKSQPRVSAQHLDSEKFELVQFLIRKQREQILRGKLFQKSVSEPTVVLCRFLDPEKEEEEEEEE